MLSAQKRTRLQRVLILAGLCLTLGYVMAYRPLSQRAARLDQPLLALWRELLTVSVQTNAFGDDYLPRIGEALDQARQAMTAVGQLSNALALRIALDPATRERMNQPFQLIDFQNERQIRVEELTRLAGQQQVTLGPAIVAGFPEYTADRRYPQLLWMQLTLVHHLLGGAVRAKVTSVPSVDLPPLQFHSLGTNAPEMLVEVPVHVELTGPAGAVLQYLESLPLRPDEIQARGLPEAPPTKPVMFIQRVLLRKEVREKVDEVRLELTISGFVTLARRETD